MFESIAQETPYQQIQYKNHKITIKRLDMIHPQISGNKFFKLKYNFLEAQKLGYKSVLTFGGAFSNHIAATAYAAHRFGFKSIGIIRGEELAHLPLNSTLSLAQQLGMQLNYISRKMYKIKHMPEVLHAFQSEHPNAYIIPEGGTNHLAIQACKEILTDYDREHFDVVCCAVGTGGTIAGLIESTKAHQKIIGFSALKGQFLADDVRQWTTKTHWEITDQYCCGGYAKTTPQLLEFTNKFEQEYQIPLEHIYTAKMMMGIFDLIDQETFSPNAQILAIHTGGLQGKFCSKSH